MNYHIDTISDFLKIPADRRAACFREIEYVLQLYELTFGEDASDTPIGSLVWADDGQTSISVADSDGDVLLTMDVTTKNAAGADLTPPTPDAPAWHDAPTCAGSWVAASASRIFQMDEFNLHAYQKTSVRWYGPIPKDAT